MDKSKQQGGDFISGITGFSENLLHVNDFAELAGMVIACLAQNLKPVYISFLLFRTADYRLLIDKYYGQFFLRTTTPVIQDCENVAASVASGGEVLAFPEGTCAKFLALFDPDQGERCEIRIPFFVNKKVIGILSLGKQQSGMDYSAGIINILNVFINSVTLACHNICLKNEIFTTATKDSSVKRNDYQPRIRIKAQDDHLAIMGTSPGIEKIRDMIERVAAQDVPVLISGESGTGKELIARAIHQKSGRAVKPLVTMNCAAMPENLVESELFGHERGAFTGAVAQKKGKFEYAHESTLFLDEIGDMNLSTQAKLLRVLQDGQFQRVGSNQTIYADVRLVAATNQNLRRCIKEGLFREDLYYRVNVVELEMPPLRERGDDIVYLADYFLQYFNERYGKSIIGFNDKTRRWLLNYHFPGNVRELKNIVERSVIMSQGPLIMPDMMPPAAGGMVHSPNNSGGQSLEALEKQHILAVMQQVNNNKSAASRLLGIARKTLREKMQRYGIEQ
ncbi:MAG TPA: sigma-54 dependent transcriptional regulator [bacterium]|nr:sigma-54 dependent transcriptional regulator [bacterium]HPN44404.1 sigma-54 dependent transcriptional regulator [bacterium]